MVYPAFQFSFAACLWSKMQAGVLFLFDREVNHYFTVKLEVLCMLKNEYF
jgi:hypothetical protein